jgi:Ca2+-binding EF-hand superfamily protein
MKKTFILLTAASMLSAAPAFAINLNPSSPAQIAQYYMTQIDTDHDGKISKAEHDAFSQQMFTKADTNGDGYISMDELTTAKKQEQADINAGTGMTNKYNNAKKDFSTLKTDLLGK